MAINPTIQNGPNLIVKINGFVQGYASGLRYQILQGQTPFFGVDSPLPQEIAQGASPSLVSGSFIMFRIVGGSLEKSGIMGTRVGGYDKAPGSATSFAPTTPQDSSNSTGQSTSTPYGETYLGAAKYSVIEISDRNSGNMIVKFTYCMFGDVSWSADARGVMTGQVSFQAILASENETPINPSWI